ncbi:MAG TPA: hypothetical protein EYO33_31955 [Phycisphaerales bacterium]|nr:hypothetical protein [Phycisphaerales bacterium]
MLGITTMSTSSLRHTTFSIQDDQALYAADAGLTRALAEYQANSNFSDASGSGQTVYSGKIASTGALYSVNLYSNDTSAPITVPGGAEIPPNTALLVSEGTTASKRSKRRSAVLVQKGLGTVQVGSLANAIKSENSKFFAFDSRKEAADYVGTGVDPNSLVSQQAVIATNEASGTPVELTNSEVKGSILVGPGGDPNAQVSKDSNSTTGQVGVLTEKIEIPDIDVPALPADDDSGDPPVPATYKPTSASDHISFSQASDGTMTIINQCFKCIIQPNGDFEVSEDAYGSNGAKHAKGNLLTGQYTNLGGSNFDIAIEDDAFLIGGDWHGIKMASDGTFAVDPPSNSSSSVWASGNTQTFTAPAWVQAGIFDKIPPDETNPTDLDSGYYGDVEITSGITELVDSSTMVIRNLEINSGGQLNLPKDGKDVTIYVTGSLKINGLNAILNETRSAPNLKIYYTGKEPVEVSGGGSSFVTLFAPDAPITLSGEGSTFYGALATRKALTLKDAEFYYDVATEGVGTGTDGTTMKILAHQRL